MKERIQLRELNVANENEQNSKMKQVVGIVMWSPFLIDINYY